MGLTHCFHDLLLNREGRGKKSLIHYITTDSRGTALNFNLSQISSDKLLAVSHAAYPRSKFSKGKKSGFAGEVGSGTHFSLFLLQSFAL